MQLINAPDEITFPSVEKAIEEQRLNRYFRQGASDKKGAFARYLWNAALCESFVVPLQFGEILCRNALHRALTKRAGADWHSDKTFRIILSDRFQQELREVLAERARQHGTLVTAHHIVSGLTFGFWEHLATKRFERYLWAKGVQHVFPGAPAGATHEDLHTLIESVRRWRNRIAHHKAIFDKKPDKKHDDAIQLIKWVCGDTGAWVAQESKFTKAMALKPN